MHSSSVLTVINIKHCSTVVQFVSSCDIPGMEHTS